MHTSVPLILVFFSSVTLYSLYKWFRSALWTPSSSIRTFVQFWAHFLSILFRLFYFLIFSFGHKQFNTFLSFSVHTLLAIRFFKSVNFPVLRVFHLFVWFLASDFTWLGLQRCEVIWDNLSLCADVFSDTDGNAM